GAADGLGEVWHTAPPAERGLGWPEIRRGDTGVRGLYLLGVDPFGDDPTPSPSPARRGESAPPPLAGVGSVEFLVVQDLFLTETARRADVVLPAVSWAEKEGTLTNLERRVQRIRPAV